MLGGEKRKHISITSYLHFLTLVLSIQKCGEAKEEALMPYEDIGGSIPKGQESRQ